MDGEKSSCIYGTFQSAQGYKMTTKTKPVEGWVVLTPNNKQLMITFMPLKKTSIFIFLSHKQVGKEEMVLWETYHKKGYRAVRATLKVNE